MDDLASLHRRLSRALDLSSLLVLGALVPACASPEEPTPKGTETKVEPRDQPEIAATPQPPKPEVKPVEVTPVEVKPVEVKPREPIPRRDRPTCPTSAMRPQGNELPPEDPDAPQLLAHGRLDRRTLAATRAHAWRELVDPLLAELHGATDPPRALVARAPLAIVRTTRFAH